MKRKREIIPVEYNRMKQIINLLVGRDKALFAAMYGSAARISEIRVLKKENVEVRERHNKKILVLTIPNRKNRIAQMKSIPIPFEESWLVEAILDWKESPICIGEYMFNIGDRQIRNLCHNYFGVHPHILRHSRLTHLIQIWDANLERVRKIAGWSDLKPSSRYVHLAWGDTADIWS